MALAAGSNVQAQNLVPNPSFEEFVTCPDATDQISRATGWSSYFGSADYFNACALALQQTDVPYNSYGFQFASDGQGYAGVMTYIGPGGAPDPDHSKEVFGAVLAEHLIPNVPVYLSLKVSSATNGFQVAPRWACNGIGMRFSMIADYDGNGPHPNAAAIHLDAVPMDTVNWILVSGVYVPDSAYGYVMVGNFFSDSLLTPEIVDSGGNTNWAFMFVDEVCASFTPEDCGLTTNMSAQNEMPACVYPNPFSTELHIKPYNTAHIMESITLSDALGNICWRGALLPGQDELTIQGPNLADGPYAIHFDGASGVKKALILIHVSPLVTGP